MGQDFSGSCTVTSRNSLIQIGATTATKSERFDNTGRAAGSIVKGLPLRTGAVCYRELRRILLPRTPLNKGMKNGPRQHSISSIKTTPKFGTSRKWVRRSSVGAG
jgi:hypothetical protein